MEYIIHVAITMETHTMSPLVRVCRKSRVRFFFRQETLLCAALSQVDFVHDLLSDGLSAERGAFHQ